MGNRSEDESCVAARWEDTESILQVLLFAGLVALAWLLPGQSYPQVTEALQEDDTCNTGELRTAPCWEPVCGE